jgi:hypothetical protein
MRQFLKCGMIVTAATVLAFFGVTKPASAEPQGLSKSYVGAGVGSVGSFAGHVSGRVTLGKAPVSIRATLYGNYQNDVFAALIIPVATYDIGIAKNTNAYVGGGFATSVVSAGNNTFSGTSLALTAGAESEIGNNIIVYGDGTFTSGLTIVKVGVGYGF